MAKVFKLIFLFTIFGFFPLLSHGANLSISPTSGSFEVGDKVTVRVMVSSETPINAVSAVLAIPTSIFSIESVSKSGSILNFWVTEPTFSKGAGILSFEGVKLNGFPGGTGAVVTATLKAIAPGTGTILFNSGQILANDGQGTDVTSGMSKATFAVVPKKEVPVTTPKASVKEEVVVEEEISEPEVKQVPASLLPPAIELGKKFGEQAIYGNTDYLTSEVLLTFISKTGTKVFIIGETDDKGSFILLVPQTLRQGIYQVSAIVIEERETISYSHASNIIQVRIGNIFSDIGITVKIGIFVIIFILLYFIFRVFMYARNNNIIRAYLERDVKEMNSILTKSEKDLGRRSTSSALKDIKEAESLINKELRDIDKL